MSAGGPFRSHLLQQWARSSQGRAPAAVATWLKSPADSSTDADGKALDSDGLTAQQQQQQQQIRHPHYLPQVPSISTLDSVSYGGEASSSGSWELSAHHTARLRTIQHPPTLRLEGSNTRQTSNRTFATSASTDFRSGKLPSETSLSLMQQERHEQRNSPGRLLSSASSHRTDHHHVVDQGHLSTNGESQVTEIDPSMATVFQSLLKNRRTATHWKAPILHEESSSSAAGEQKLRMALDRAVACAQMAPNHKRTEPFSFKRFLMGSKAATDLANISYNVTLRKSGSEPNAQAKRQKWLAIPGFLVMLVHENQSSNERRSVLCETDDDYALLPYSPPETERQLEDVSDSTDSSPVGPNE